MAPMRLSKRGRLVLSAALLAFSAGLLLATGFDLGLMMLLPALTLAAVLIVWPHPGLDLILRIATRRRPFRPHRGRPAALRPPAAAVRGGRLIASSLGGRAPPLLARPALA